jgi:CheY-like chemotaxis protein
MSTYKALIVDDSKLARMSVIKKLAALQPDWSYIEAKNAEEALAMAAQSAVDVALLDFSMPGSMDGLQLAATLLANTEDLAVAIISANAQSEIIKGARKAKC